LGRPPTHFPFRRRRRNGDGAGCCFEHPEADSGQSRRSGAQTESCIQIANIETATRQQDRAIARAALLPQAGLEADDAIVRYNTKAQLGVQPAIIPHDVGPYQAIHVGPAFSTPLFDLTLIRRYQASGHRLLAGQADEQTVREETVLLAVSEYMAHLRALAGIIASQSRVGLAERLTRQAQDLLTDGVASKIDESRAKYG
jgi:outer membrane protein